jgi:hypothetical protein
MDRLAYRGCLVVNSFQPPAETPALLADGLGLSSSHPFGADFGASMDDSRHNSADLEPSSQKGGDVVRIQDDDTLELNQAVPGDHPDADPATTGAGESSNQFRIQPSDDPAEALPDTKAEALESSGVQGDEELAGRRNPSGAWRSTDIHCSWVGFFFPFSLRTICTLGGIF